MPMKAGKKRKRTDYQRIPPRLSEDQLDDIRSQAEICRGQRANYVTAWPAWIIAAVKEIERVRARDSVSG